jgi:hypothetical protein
MRGKEISKVGVKADHVLLRSLLFMHESWRAPGVVCRIRDYYVENVPTPTTFQLLPKGTASATTDIESTQ